MAQPDSRRPLPQPIRFHHRGRLVTVDDPRPTRTVLEWLREDARCTGTKEGCAEGDCGACTVVVGECAVNPDGAPTLSLSAVNACIRFLPTLDGRMLFTVEDLAQDDKLHPVQRALVECHGSQCGFCTPGFVMSLFAVYEHCLVSGIRPSREELAHALAGNLCRCTGYRPILDAAEKMFDIDAAAPVRIDRKALARSLPASNAGQEAFHAPSTIEELARIRLERPDARLLAGGTDVGLWVNKQLRELNEIIWLGNVAALRTIREEAHGTLSIGAGATLEAAWSALARRYPELREMWLRFGSPPVRNAGTLGGNVANGSPIGDGAPVLLVLGASLVLRRGEQSRRLALEDFYLDYMRNCLEPGEFLQAIEVPPRRPNTQLRAWKISKRFDSDISAVSLGALLRLEDGRIREARIAFGGMAAVVKRAEAVESLLDGRPWTEPVLREAQRTLASEFQPIDDLRASRVYRTEVATNLLERLWLETRADAPLDAGRTRVWTA